jgi:hypothetical protein
VPDSDPPSAIWHAGAVTAAVRNAPPEILKHQYEQVCASYHAIDDFRGRLLALWPILGGAAGAVALLVAEGKSTGVLVSLGVFGFLVSCGVGLYEWTQTLRCVELRDAACRLEKDMDLLPEQAQFLSQKEGYNLRSALKGELEEGKFVRTGNASAVVYFSVIVGWLIIAISPVYGVFWDEEPDRKVTVVVDPQNSGVPPECGGPELNGTVRLSEVAGDVVVVRSVQCEETHKTLVLDRDSIRSMAMED